MVHVWVCTQLKHISCDSNISNFLNHQFIMYVCMYVCVYVCLYDRLSYIQTLSVCMYVCMHSLPDIFHIINLLKTKCHITTDMPLVNSKLDSHRIIWCHGKLHLDNHDRLNCTMSVYTKLQTVELVGTELTKYT